MTHHEKTRTGLLGAAGALAILAGTLAGCGGDEPQTQAVPTAAPSRPKAPPAPPKPRVTPIDQLMADLGIDARVVLAEKDAPDNDPARRAVLEFFDGFARGDSAAVGSMLSNLDRDELDALVDSGAWDEATAKVEQIDVITGPSPDGRDCALAIMYVGNSHQAQLWYYTTQGGVQFDAVAAPPNMMDRLYGDDWIALWFEILEQEMALADKPDEELVIPQQDVSDPSRVGGPVGPGVSPSSPAPSNPSSPSAPPGMPGKRPGKPKRAPPGKGR